MTSDTPTSDRSLHFASDAKELKDVIARVIPSDVVFTHGDICVSKEDGSIMGYIWFPINIGKDMCTALSNPISPTEVANFLTQVNCLVMPPIPLPVDDHKRVWQIESFHADGEGHSLCTMIKYIPAKHLLN